MDCFTQLNLSQTIGIIAGAGVSTCENNKHYETMDEEAKNPSWTRTRKSIKKGKFSACLLEDKKRKDFCIICVVIHVYIYIYIYIHISIFELCLYTTKIT